MNPPRLFPQTLIYHKTSPSKFKRIEIISNIFSNHNGMKLEINYRKKNGIKNKQCRLNNMLLKKQWVSDEIKEEFRKYLEINENGNTTFQNLWDEAKAVLRGNFIAI